MKIQMSYKSYILFTFLYLVMLFQYPLSSLFRTKINPILYVDEILTIIACLYVILNINCKYVREKFNYRLLKWIVLLISLGLISSVFYRYQNVMATLIDAMSFFRCFIIYLAMYTFVCKHSKQYKIILFLNNITKAIVYLLVSLILINLIFNIFPQGDYRYFMYAQKLFYDHPAQLSATGISMLIVLVCNSKYKKNDFAIISCSLLIFSTLRTKDIGAVIAILFIYLYFLKGKFKSRKLLYLAIFIVLIFVGWSMIEEYYGNSVQARSALLTGGFEVANDHFPLGAGFGTFGTNMSATSYSPLYNIYGLSNVWGLNSANSSFISDTFWPAIIAEVGYLGLFIYIVILKQLIKTINRTFTIDKFLFVTGISVMIYELIASVGSAAFFHPNAIILFSIFACCMASFQNESRQLEELEHA